MNLVLLTGDGPEHRYVANRLDREVGLTAVVVDRGKQMTSKERRAQLRRRYSWPQLAGRGAHQLALRLIDDAAARRDQFRQVLGPDSQEWACARPLHRVQGINGDDAREVIEGIRPDRLLVYGTTIVGPKVLALGSLTPLNMHTGWSPDYRGGDCAFWPLFDGRPDLLGATVHEVTAEVDGGKIFGRIRPRLEAEDRIHAIFARCVAAGTDLYVDVVSRLMRGEDVEPVVQDLNRGHEYRGVDRTLWADVKVRSALRRGLVRDHCLHAARGAGTG